jgi:hypothetical protein
VSRDTVVTGTMKAPPPSSPWRLRVPHSFVLHLVTLMPHSVAAVRSVTQELLFSLLSVTDSRCRIEAFDLAYPTVIAGAAPLPERPLAPSALTGAPVAGP